jgi:hypothetical protein
VPTGCRKKKLKASVETTEATRRRAAARMCGAQHDEQQDERHRRGADVRDVAQQVGGRGNRRQSRQQHDGIAAERPWARCAILSPRAGAAEP